MTTTGPFLLDTNIIVHVLRNDSLFPMIERAVDLKERNITSVVVVGECRSLNAA